jgi:uncharacterized membrane protein YesL
MNEHTKPVIDAMSLGTVVGTLAGWLPAVAALFTIIWTAIRIYETKTVQKIIQRWKGRTGE